MRPKLKEKPTEWRKFALVWSAFFALLAWQGQRKGFWSREAFLTALGVLGASALAALVYPRIFRVPYRAVMTLTSYVGQFFERILLGVVFFVMIAPLGLLLRAFGKDLLNLKRDSSRPTYWESPRSSGGFERLF